MRDFIIILIFCFITWACSKSDNSNLKSISDSSDTIGSPIVENNSDSIEKINTPDTIQEREIINQTNKLNVSNLPFGCDILITHQFPKWWKVDAYARVDSILPHEKEFESISNCFNKISSVPLAYCPPVKKIEYIFYGNGEFQKCSDSIPVLYCGYKLPDFGPYSCYYIIKDAEAESNNESNCMNYGNLMFYNSISQHAKILNIYAQISGDQHVTYRFFYINENKLIQIFEGSCYDDGCSLINKYRIKVQESGLIEIKENK